MLRFLIKVEEYELEKRLDKNAGSASRTTELSNFEFDYMCGLVYRKKDILSS